MRQYQNQYLETVGINQRNWSDQPVPSHHIEYLVTVAANTPTKQSNRYWNLLAITNKDLLQCVYEGTRCWDHANRCWHYNSQMTAPLVIFWIKSCLDVGQDTYYLDESEHEDVIIDTHQSAGISAGITAYEAAQLGYRTGFCRCFPDQKNFLEQICSHTQFEAKRLRNGNLPGDTICVALGIGLGTEDSPRYDGVRKIQLNPTDKCLPKVFLIS